MNTANKITIVRILFVPILIWLIYNIHESTTFAILATALFILISVTDMLDGYIARNYNQITDFGKFLDPLADKILVISTMVALVELGLMSGIAVIIVIAREFLVTSLRLVAKDNVVIAASFWGKLKTIFQMVAIVVVMLSPTISILKTYYISDIFVWIMTALTVISGIDYLVKNIKYVNYKK